MPHSTDEPDLERVTPPNVVRADAMASSSSVPEIPGVKCGYDLAQNFRHEVAELLGRRNPNFPGAQPISFSRKHLQALEQTDYFLCEKTDGIRCLLYTTSDETGREIHYLIDRKNDYYWIDHGDGVPGISEWDLHLPHHEDPDFGRPHNGLLMDGELVNDLVEGGRRVLRYYAFDLLAIDNRPLLEQNFSRRIGKLKEWVLTPAKKLRQAHPVDCAGMPFEVVGKEMTKPYQLDYIFGQLLPTLPHGHDGLIFQCATKPYVPGTDESILKWKPPHENTIDFMLRLGPFPEYDPQDGQGPAYDYDSKPSFELWIFYGKDEYRLYDHLHVTDEEWEVLKAANRQLDGRIIECYRDDKRRWRYKTDGEEGKGQPRFRDDKPDANHVSTAVKVLETIEDGVTQKDLFDTIPKVKPAWKKRHPEEPR